MTQPDLFAPRVGSDPPPRDTRTIQQRFEDFHRNNPQVYALLVKLARKYAAQNRQHKCAIGTLWEVLRWSSYFEPDWHEEFKANNNYRSRYARLIAAQEPDLAEVFELRELKAA